MSPYPSQQSFSDPGIREQVLDLVDVVFPGMKKAVLAGISLGAEWEAEYTPFVRFEGPLAVAHVGVLDIPMVLLGKRVRVAGIHAVCTHPDHRGRGHFRSLMAEVLDYCDENCDAVILFTGKTYLYEPLGFRTVEEHVFRVESPAEPSKSPPGGGLRMLDNSCPEDRRRLHALLSARCPLSDVLDVQDNPALFCVNEASRNLHYAEDLDAVFSLSIDGPRLRLFDVVARRLPSLDDLLARVDGAIREVELLFCAERIAPDAAASPHLLSHTPQALGGAFRSQMMVKGSFPPEGRPFMVPPSARC